MTTIIGLAIAFGFNARVESFSSPQIQIKAPTSYVVLLKDQELIAKANGCESAGELGAALRDDKLMRKSMGEKTELILDPALINSDLDVQLQIFLNAVRTWDVSKSKELGSFGPAGKQAIGRLFTGGMFRDRLNLTQLQRDELRISVMPSIGIKVISNGKEYSDHIQLARYPSDHVTPGISFEDASAAAKLLPVTGPPNGTLKPTLKSGFSFFYFSGAASQEMESLMLTAALKVMQELREENAKKRKSLISEACNELISKTLRGLPKENVPTKFKELDAEVQTALLSSIPQSMIEGGFKTTTDVEKFLANSVVTIRYFDITLAYALPRKGDDSSMGFTSTLRATGY